MSYLHILAAPCFNLFTGISMCLLVYCSHSSYNRQSVVTVFISGPAHYPLVSDFSCSTTISLMLLVIFLCLRLLYHAQLNFTDLNTPLENTLPGTGNCRMFSHENSFTGCIWHFCLAPCEFEDTDFQS